MLNTGMGGLKVCIERTGTAAVRMSWMRWGLTAALELCDVVRDNLVLFLCTWLRGNRRTSKRPGTNVVSVYEEYQN